jgi:Thioesterase-like superfamily
MTLPVVDNGKSTIGEEWLQGRTAYGGASAAIALKVTKLAHPDLPPLRSAQIAFVGPLAGDVVATPTLLRRGKNSAFVGVDVAGTDGIGLRALFLFMANRESSIRHGDLSITGALAPDDMPTDGSAIGPGFLSNFELAKAGDPAPGNWLRWARLKDRHELDPEVELIAIADALPPAAMSLAAAWGPISTTTWQLNVVGAPETRDGWWLLGAEALHTADGNSSQTMTIWNRDGAAVATATQSVALFI